MHITPKRESRFKDVIANRQLDLCVVLENVHDPHNIGAVLRSCDSVGISDVYVIITDDRIKIENYYIGKNSSSGARKWIEVHIYREVAECLEIVKSKYKNLYATHLSAEAKSLYELDLSESTALLFGNESTGLSEECLSYVDGNFLIPQVGMVQSLNISVACAVSLYEALRQRTSAGLYDQSYSVQTEGHGRLFELYLDRHANPQFWTKQP